jgi:hypothetical protein
VPDQSHDSRNSGENAVEQLMPLPEFEPEMIVTDRWLAQQMNQFDEYLQGPFSEAARSAHYSLNLARLLCPRDSPDIESFADTLLTLTTGRLPRLRVDGGRSTGIALARLATKLGNLQDLWPTVQHSLWPNSDAGENVDSDWLNACEEVGIFVTEFVMPWVAPLHDMLEVYPRYFTSRRAG